MRLGDSSGDCRQSLGWQGYPGQLLAWGSVLVSPFPSLIHRSGYMCNVSAASHLGCHLTWIMIFRKLFLACLSALDRVTKVHMQGSAHDVCSATGGHAITALGFMRVFFAHWAPSKLGAWVLCQPSGCGRHWPLY
eukprot:1149300-Pelagomonas_calceolata.AAC.3